MADQFYLRGKKELEEGSPEKAVELLKEALRIDPQNEEIRFELSRAYLKGKNWKESLAVLDRLLIENPENADYIGQRGVTHFSRGDVKSALVDLERAIELEPNYGYRYACRAYVRERIGELEAAIADYEKAFSLDPEDKVAENNLELAREKLKYQQAEAFRNRKTKAHLSKEEIKAYTEEYKRKNKEEHVSPQNEQKVEGKQSSLLREMIHTLRSPEKRKDFFSFLLNGFRHRS